MSEIATLKKIEQSKLAIREVKTLDEIKNIVDQAEALKAYARSAKMSAEIQADIAELNIRATRKLGEISKMLEKAKGNQYKKVECPQHGQSKTATLESIGVTRQRANEAEKLASIPEQEFEFKMAEVKKVSDTIPKTLFIPDEDSKKQRNKEFVSACDRVAVFRKTGKKPEGWRDGIDDKLVEESIAREKRLKAYWKQLEEKEEVYKKQYPFYPTLMKYLDSIKNPDKKKEACQNIIKTCNEVLSLT